MRSTRPLTLLTSNREDMTPLPPQKSDELLKAVGEEILTSIKNLETKASNLKARMEENTSILRGTAGLTIKEFNEFLNEGINWIDDLIENIKQGDIKPRK